MKQKIISPDKGVAPAAQDKPRDHAASQLKAEMDALNVYWLAYPFMPMMDIIIVFDELRKMVKSWFQNKRKRTTICKKKTP
ncbi:hypothetical protein [Taibaiella koreensis]|uniref:hypothetical protein n=1 Tax=Taibaiella koreensis TaxID=1268548 RepID=UPI000E59CE56|nr:hypothetical protein [Taibaiella koreensis]